MEHVNGQQGTGDLSMLDAMGVRAPRIVVEDWWLVLARQLVEHYPPGLVVLGRELAKEVGRTSAYSHSLLSKFANKKIGATRDLQEAICKKFDIPPPIFFPRTITEAFLMLKVKNEYDAIVEKNTPPPGSVATVRPISPTPTTRHAHGAAPADEPHGIAPHASGTRRR